MGKSKADDSAGVASDAGGAADASVDLDSTVRIKPGGKAAPATPFEGDAAASPDARPADAAPVDATDPLEDTAKNRARARALGLLMLAPDAEMARYLRAKLPASNLDEQDARRLRDIMRTVYGVAFGDGDRQQLAKIWRAVCPPRA